MDAGLKAKWIVALRSGKYRQARGAWVVGDDPNEMLNSHCCLDVLHVLEGRPKFIGGKLDFAINRIGEDACRALVRLNDGTDIGNSGSTDFPKIAEWIEKNL